MSRSRIERNIPKNYLYIFLWGTSLSEAIWMLYLAWRGLSLVEIGLVESIFHVTSLLMEVPTGIIADRFGRKTSRILGRGVAMVGTLLMISSRSFWGFALAFVFIALSYNLESGAGDALVYDSLKQAGKQDRYTKVKGRQEVSWQAAQILSLVASGIVATFDYTLAYFLSLGVQATSLVVALTFEEPLAGGAGTRKRASGLVQHVVVAFRTLRDNRGIFVYILFIEGFSLFCTTLHFYFQTFLKSRGFIEWQIGLVLAGASLAGMLGAAGTHRLEQRFGKRWLVSLSPFVALAAFGLIAFTPLEIPGMLLRAAVEGILFVSFSDSINRLIPSEHRATLLSFEAMTFSLMMIVLFPVIGAVADRAGFKTAFVVIFAAAVPLLLGSRWLLLRKMKKELPPPTRRGA
jgi:MFS family permease